MAAGVVDLAIQIHQTPNRGAVDVGDRRQVDEDVAFPGRDERADGGREVAEDRVHQARLADAYDRDAAGLVGFDIHPYAPVRFSAETVGLSFSPRHPLT